MATPLKGCSLWASAQILFFSPGLRLKGEENPFLVHRVALGHLDSLQMVLRIAFCCSEGRVGIRRASTVCSAWEVGDV